MLPTTSRPILNTTSDGIPRYSNSGYETPCTLQEMQVLIERELFYELIHDICYGFELHSPDHKVLQKVSPDMNRCSLLLDKGEKGDSSRPILKRTSDGIQTFLAESFPGTVVALCNSRSVCADRKICRISRSESSSLKCLVSQILDISCNSTVETIQQKEICIPLCNDIVNHQAEYRESHKVSDCYKVLLAVKGIAEKYCRSQICSSISINTGEELVGHHQRRHGRLYVLLAIAHMVFEEQSTIDQTVHRIMIHTLSFLQTERCQVLLLDENTKTLNIPDVYQDDRFDPSVDEDRNFRHHSILCMPIRNASKNIIGVNQIINKLNGDPFTKNDENFFEIFAIFCGLGIQHAQVYERSMKAIAKTKVTLEVLSYHAIAPLKEVQELLRDYHIPSTEMYKLNDLKFDDFSLNDKEMLKASLRMFMDLGFIQRFGIQYDVLCRWLLSVRKNYRTVTYHNWRHAFNVTQMMFAILTVSNLHNVLGELETLSLLIACLCHDLDHRGTNNSFQKKSNSPLAQLYSTSTMEHHHFDQCVMLLNSEGNQILSHLSPEEHMNVVHVLEDAILATDLSVHYKKQLSFIQIARKEHYNWKREDNRRLLRAMLMTACDIAAITKPWEIQKKVKYV
ncbi:dual 3',5'-cyclic-AMP and -GMP phosphodiesterase 11 [Caerostris darwini]|uniref:Phosphodiesterase n=1 Tax=Caerostris darwini TaxID=1538125 RepID=A0AAV4S7C8_9ARAC|nr:dual 3',5'-cyclic-AMP and -GMP phosphodiesterase 11 [Caerostris darwini]